MAAKRRKRLSRAQILALASEFESSNVTRREFCHNRGISISALSRYLRRYRDGAGAAVPRWVEVEVRPDAQSGVRAELTICLPRGLRVEVLPGFDPATLRQLLSVVEPS